MDIYPALRIKILVLPIPQQTQRHKNIVPPFLNCNENLIDLDGISLLSPSSSLSVTQDLKSALLLRLLRSFQSVWDLSRRVYFQGSKLGGDGVGGEIISFILLPHAVCCRIEINQDFFENSLFPCFQIFVHFYSLRASWVLHYFPFFEHLPESVKRRLQSEDTRPTCIWMSGKNPTNFRNRKVSRSNAHCMLLAVKLGPKYRKEVNFFHPKLFQLLLHHSCPVSPTLLIIILIHILSFLSLLALSCFISFNIFALDGNENRGFTSSEREGGRFPGKSEKVFNFESDLDYHLLNITDGWSSHF